MKNTGIGECLFSFHIKQWIASFSMLSIIILRLLLSRDVSNYSFIFFHFVSLLRVLSFEYLNQQLVWRELSDLFIVLAPIFTSSMSALVVAATMMSSWTNSFSGYGLSRGVINMVQNGVGSNDSNSGDVSAYLEKYRTSDVDTVRCCKCGVIGNHAPYVAIPCGHHFCYYCISQHCINDKGGGHVRCVICQKKIQKICPMRKIVES